MTINDRRKGGSVYQPTPTIELIFGADDDFIGVAIHRDEALGFRDVLQQIEIGDTIVNILERRLTAMRAELEKLGGEGPGESG